MDETFEINEDQIRELCTAKVFARGEELLADEALSDLRLIGPELFGSCLGSQYKPYELRAVVGESGIESTDCNCPYDGQGICKHLVALLLCFAHLPERFDALPSLAEMLRRRSREQLMDLIAAMIREQPSLLNLLELAMPIEDGDEESLRRNLRRALKSGDARLLDKAVRAGEKRGNSFLTAVQHAALLEEITTFIPRLYENSEDEDFFVEVADAAQFCVGGIAIGLGEKGLVQDARRAWVFGLLDLELAEIEIGGMDLSGNAREVILNHVAREDWTEIQTRVRAQATHTEAPIRGAIVLGSSSLRDYRREALVQLLIEIAAQLNLTDEIESIIEALGTSAQKIFLQARQGKTKDAIKAARKEFTAQPRMMTQFADALEKSGSGQAARELLEELATRDSTGYLAWGYEEWLAQYCHRRSEPQAAFDWALRLLARRAEPEHYELLREVAVPLGDWDEVRGQVETHFDKEKRFTALLWLALREKQSTRALELLDKIPKGERSLYLERVAQLAEREHPQRALELFRELAERAIEGRERKHYREAAKHLARVKALHKKLSTPEAWDEYFATLREVYSNLRALQDELSKAGL
jgi:hypothetical protein